MSELMSRKLKECYESDFDDTEGHKRIFGTWTTYEEDINAGQWLAPVKVAAYVQHNFNPDVSIGDIACGTGLVAKLLKPGFYTNIEGYDITVEFLEKAKEHYKSTTYNDITAEALPKQYRSSYCKWSICSWSPKCIAK